MEQKGCFRPLVTTSAVIGALQSILWIALSLASILTFRGVLKIPENLSNTAIITILKIYFQNDDFNPNLNLTGFPNLEDVELMRPIELFSWLVAYLVVSIMCLILSFCLWSGVNASFGHLRMTLQCWCFLTVVVSVMDVVLTVKFAFDYLVLREACEKQSDKVDVTPAVAAAFVVSARGFLLWLMNVGETIYFLIWLADVHEVDAAGSHLTPKTANGIPFQKREKFPGGVEREAYDNLSFQNTLESLPRRESARPDAEHAPSHLANRSRRYSEDSLEAVTPFNVEESPEREYKNPDECDFYHISGNTQTTARSGLRPPFLGDGWPQLKLELERKLQDSIHAPKPKKLSDFSHDLRNFRQGEGRGKAHGRIPPPPPLPSAVTCSDSSFF